MLEQFEQEFQRLFNALNTEFPDEADGLINKIENLLDLKVLGVEVKSFIKELEDV